MATSNCFVMTVFSYLGELTLLMWRITNFFVRIYLATINNQCLFGFFMEYHGSCSLPPPQQKTIFNNFLLCNSLFSLVQKKQAALRSALQCCCMSCVIMAVNTVALMS